MIFPKVSWICDDKDRKLEGIRGLYCPTPFREIILIYPYIHYMKEDKLTLIWVLIHELIHWLTDMLMPCSKDIRKNVSWWNIQTKIDYISIWLQTKLHF